MLPSSTSAAVAAWSGRDAWIAALRAALSSAQGEEQRSAAHVAADTLMRVALDDAATADSRSGRGVATAHETVAARLGMSAKTVQRARDLLIALGFAVVLAEGRYLTTAEREAATRTHGGRQVRAASTRALTIPRASRAQRRSSPPVQNVHLPRRGVVNPRTYVPENSPTRAHARSEAAPRPLRKTSRTRVERSPRALGIQQLAAQLAARMPWLARDRHIGHLCDLLDRHELADRGWTATQLLDQIDRANRDGLVLVADPGAQRDGLAYFAWNLRRAVPVGAVAPSRRAAAERAARLAEQAQARAAETARRERIAEQADEIAAIIADMKRRFPSRKVVAK